MEVCDYGMSKELANYGEYSGAPTTEETFLYARTLIQLMVKYKADKPKYLFVGGGIANFTDVPQTFTGLIKANIPSRIAFQVSSKVDSRTILDQMGAEALLGHGDMLYLPVGSSIPERIHGAFVSDEEVHRVVAELQKQGKPQYQDEVLSGAPESAGSAADLRADAGEGGRDTDDEYYDRAVYLVTSSRRASISGVQRHLRIGYNRAARLVEEMERQGVVGPVQPNGSREVLAEAPPEH